MQLESVCTCRASSVRKTFSGVPKSSILLFSRSLPDGLIWVQVCLRRLKWCWYLIWQCWVAQLKFCGFRHRSGGIRRKMNRGEVFSCSLGLNWQFKSSLKWEVNFASDKTLVPKWVPSNPQLIMCLLSSCTAPFCQEEISIFNTIYFLFDTSYVCYCLPTTPEDYMDSWWQGQDSYLRPCLTSLLFYWTSLRRVAALQLVSRRS